MACECYEVHGGNQMLDYVECDDCAAKAARPEGATDCDGVCKDGTYFGAGRVENGKFIGFTGTCFRCGGKGYQTESDRKRNWGYDRNRRFTF